MDLPRLSSWIHEPYACHIHTSIQAVMRTRNTEGDHTCTPTDSSPTCPPISQYGQDRSPTLVPQKQIMHAMNEGMNEEDYKGTSSRLTHTINSRGAEHTHTEREREGREN
mmetsp:Transcript_46239/g.91202  ORF Transcript_46239/g.91202 Transcript_46239/m.91202 type:complete len:110 (-) Transcript_46239:186-515(-)